MRTEFLCISVLRAASGPRAKLASCKSALPLPPPPTHARVVYSTDCSKAVILVLFLFFVALWFQHCFLFFSICVVMQALSSPSSTSAHFAFCFPSGVLVLAFWSPLTTAQFAFCFTGCVVVLAFWSPSTAAHFAFCFTSCN